MDAAPARLVLRRARVDERAAPPRAHHGEPGARALVEGRTVTDLVRGLVDSRDSGFEEPYPSSDSATRPSRSGLGGYAAAMKIALPLGHAEPLALGGGDRLGRPLGYESIWMPEHLVIPVAASGSPNHGEEHPPVPANVPDLRRLRPSRPTWPGRRRRSASARRSTTSGSGIPSPRPGPLPRSTGSPEAASTSASAPAGSRRSGRPSGLDFATSGTTGGRGDRGLPATLARRGHRVPRRVLRLRAR